MRFGRSRTSPSAVERTVRKRVKQLPFADLLDYADQHGTAMAKALYQVRKSPDAQDALLDARQQLAVLSVLLDELRLRQEAVG